MGSEELKRDVEALSPHTHVFGHSHIKSDRLVGATRYVQCSLGYPRDPPWNRSERLSVLWPPK